MSASRSLRGHIRSLVESMGTAAPARFGMEPLEQRALLAAVAWDGDAGDNLWHTASNWSNNAVPTAADDVTIDVAANPTITFNATTGSRSVNSLVSNEALSFTGGTLTVVTTADINAAISMNSNTISGGAWNVTDATGGGITFGGSGTTLSNVNITGDLLMSAGSSYAIPSGTTRFTNARLQAGGASVRFANGYTLNDTIVVDGAAAGTRNIYHNGGGAASIGATGVVRVAAGAGGSLTFSNGAGAMTLTNNGLIVNEAAGRTLDLSITSLTNNGTLNAIAGTLDVSPTNWSNAGTIAVATGAAVNLGGTMNATGGVGTFNNTGGTVNVTGTITNTGNTFTLNNSTGSWTMVAGTINGGTINTADGRVILGTGNGGTLANLQLNGDVVMSTSSSFVNISGTTRFTNARLQASNTSVRLANGFTMNDTIVAEGAAAGGRLIYSAGGGTSTIGATGVVRLASGAGGGLTFSNGAGALTLINNGLVVNEAAGRTLDFQNSGLTNNGTINAVAGTIDISPSNWSNTGAIAVSPGAAVNLGGTLNATAGIGTFNNTGGTINVTGTITNTGNTFTLNTSTGSWTVVAGTINGGTINTANGQTLLTSGSGGTLTNLQFNGDIVMSATSAYVNLSGTTRFNNARLQASNASVRFIPGYTLNDTIVAEGAAAGNRIIYSTGAGTSTVGATGVIRLASGVGGGLSFSNGAGAMTLINNGLVVNEATGRTIDFQNTALTNNGTISSIAGTIDISPANWSSTGTIAVSTGAAVNLGGTMNATSGVGSFNNTGGAVNVTGTITNTGNTFTLNTSTGSWTMAGGTINGGTVNTANGRTLLTSATGGTLANLQFNGDIVMSAANAYVHVSGTTRFTTARLQAANTSIRFVPGFTLNDTVVVEGAAVGNRLIYSNGVGTSTIGATGVVRLASGAGGGLTFSNGAGALTIINNGLVVNEATGRTIDFQNTGLTNNGTINAIAGGIDISPTNWSNTGTIAVSTGASVNLGGAMNAASGIGSFNNTGGTINVTGTITNTGNTFTLNNSTGSWTMVAGTINGGTINTADGRVILGSGSGGTLANLQFNGEIIMNAGSSFVNVSGTTRFTTARLQAGNSSIRFIPAYTMSDTIIVEGAAAGTRQVYSTGGGTSNIGATGVIRIASGAGGGLSFSNGAGAMTLINNGLIVNDAAGRTLDFQITSLTNNGTIQGTAGTIDLSTPVTNYNNGTNTLTGGAWSFNNTTVTWTAATIRTIAAATSVTVGGTGTFAALNGLTTNNGLLIVNNGRTLALTPQGGTLTNNGTISSTSGVGTLGSTYSLANAATLTAATGGTLQVNAGGTNTGTIVPAAGGTVAFGTARTFTAGSFGGAGTVAFNNGAASTVSTTFNAATLATSAGGQVTFTVNASAGTVNNAGTIVLGLRTLTVSGNYNQTLDGTLEITIASLVNRGTVNVTGNANLDGTMRVVYSGYTLVREDRTTLITTGGAVNGVFLVEALGGIQSVELPRLIYNAQSVEFVVYAAGDFDGDGFVTGIDYDIFVQAFEAGDPRVDVDGDGFVTGADFDIFVIAFEQG